MKKICCLLACAFLFAGNLFAFAFGAVDLSFGSGYVWYGQNSAREKNDMISEPGQLLLTTGATYKFPLAEPVYLCFGVDSAFDFRWGGGDYVHRIDFAGLIGIQWYVVAGLVFGVDYALGWRSDFYDIAGNDNSSASDWGNGFKISLAYDFFYQSEKKLRPLVGIAWRRMPRGDGADNILSVFLKLTIQ